MMLLLLMLAVIEVEPVAEVVDAVQIMHCTFGLCGCEPGCSREVNLFRREGKEWVHMSGSLVMEGIQRRVSGQGFLIEWTDCDGLRRRVWTRATWDVFEWEEEE